MSTGRQPRIAVIGYGTIGQSLIKSLSDGMPSCPVGAVFSRRFDRTQARQSSPRFFQKVEELLAWKPTMAVECASHQAVREIIPPLLAAGVDVVLLSVGALSDPSTMIRIECAAKRGNAEFILASGAIGGLDVLRAARAGRIERVAYTGRKPPIAWAGTPAAEQIDLETLDQATVIFQGNAYQAASLYPKNANVTAAVALAGIGFEMTTVTLVADPALSVNVHEIEASGSFGRFYIKLQAAPLPENPRSSRLAVLSAEAAVRTHVRLKHISAPI